MKYKLAIWTTCLIATIFLAGCKGSGSGSAGISGGDGIYIASLSDDGSSVDDGSNDGNPIAHNPEPATLALLGSGLFAYAFLRKKKK